MIKLGGLFKKEAREKTHDGSGPWSGHKIVCPSDKGGTGSVLNYEGALVKFLKIFSSPKFE